MIPFPKDQIIKIAIVAISVTNVTIVSKTIDYLKKFLCGEKSLLGNLKQKFLNNQEQEFQEYCGQFKNYFSNYTLKCDINDSRINIIKKPNFQQRHYGYFQNNVYGSLNLIEEMIKAGAHFTTEDARQLNAVMQQITDALNGSYLQLPR